MKMWWRTKLLVKLLGGKGRVWAHMGEQASQGIHLRAAVHAPQSNFPVDLVRLLQLPSLSDGQIEATQLFSRKALFLLHRG